MIFDEIRVSNINGEVEIDLFLNGSHLRPRFKFEDGKLVYHRINPEWKDKDYDKPLEEAKTILEEYIPMDFNSLVEHIQKEVDFIVNDNLDQYNFDLNLVNERDPRHTTYEFNYQDLRGHKNLAVFRKAQDPCFAINTSSKIKDKEVVFFFATFDENIINKEENQKYINYLYENKLVK